MSLVVLHRPVLVKGRLQRCIFLPPERAAKLWLVKNGEAQPESPKQREFIKLVDRIYLAPAFAPESYRLKYPRKEDAPKPVQIEARLPYND